MNKMVVDFAKNQIEQLRREIEDMELIITEFGGKNENSAKSVGAVLEQGFKEENRRPEVYRGVVGYWDYDSGLYSWPCFDVG